MTNWISVKEKLPEGDQNILILSYSKDKKFRSITEGKFCDDKRYLILYPHRSPWAIKLFRENDFYLIQNKSEINDPHDRNNFYLGEVTHWMPLELPND